MGLLRRIGSRVRLVSRTLSCVAGPRAALRALGVLAQRRQRQAAAVDRAVPIAMRACGGGELLVRPGSSDLLNAVAYYGEGSEAPPPGVDEPATIVELGTNCGVVLTALAYRYERARLIGVEADAGNVAMARRNLERFGTRATVVHGAVWDESVELVVDTSASAGEHGFLVRPGAPGDPPGLQRLRGVTVDEVLDRELPGEDPIEYMHISIEGSEPRVLAAGGRWVARVRSLRVEVHPYFGYGPQQCIAQLEGLGFRAHAAEHPPETWVFGYARD